MWSYTWEQPGSRHREGYLTRQHWGKEATLQPWDSSKAFVKWEALTDVCSLILGLVQELWGLQNWIRYFPCQVAQGPMQNDSEDRVGCGGWGPLEGHYLEAFVVSLPLPECTSTSLILHLLSPSPYLPSLISTISLPLLFSSALPLPRAFQTAGSSSLQVIQATE